MSDTVDELTDLFSSKPATFKIYAQCMNCFDWTLIEETMENYGKSTLKAKCEHCGGSNMDPRSAISERTFNPVTAKRRRPLAKKKESGTMLA